PMQLVWAENILRRENKPVLIITPLAVGAQTVREGEKFQIECKRSCEGQAHKGITVTNYERLHYFNPADFIGVVCDECFADSTLVDTPSGRVSIKDIRVGDRILNAAGIDTIIATKRTELTTAVAITVKGQKIICRLNHP